MSKSSILPQLGYADVVWDNCSPKLSEHMESLHLDAMRTKHMKGSKERHL